VSALALAPTVTGDRGIQHLTRRLESQAAAMHHYVGLLSLDESLLADPINRQKHLAVIRRHVGDLVDGLSQLASGSELETGPELCRLGDVQQALVTANGRVTGVRLGDVDPATAQALRAIQDVRELHARSKEEQRARELAEAQQMRAVADFRTLYRRASLLSKQLDQAYLDTITALAKAVEARDQYTGHHVERVRAESLRIARRFGLSDEALRQLEFGAVLHDVGKLGIPDAILSKPGPLTPVEVATMRQHPTIGRRLLEGISFLQPSLTAVETHHEWWDGHGYPWGLAGEAIPLEGRIVAVADAYDAMTSDRPYRKGMSDDCARSLIAKGRGTQFAPDVVDAFLSDEY
jgi:hypothetical protein